MKYIIKQKKRREKNIIEREKETLKNNLRLIEERKTAEKTRKIQQMQFHLEAAKRLEKELES